MPDSTTYELLQALLQMRDQMSTDLGISYLKDDRLDAYIGKTQRAATDMREALKQKNFATGISEEYYRKIFLAEDQSEYVWLGDYPKEAERAGIPHASPCQLACSPKLAREYKSPRNSGAFARS
jgi:hypothetical protein